MSHGIKGETPAQDTPKGTTICGIVGVVFGALGLVLSFIPIVNNIAAILGAIGVVLAIIAWWGTFRGKKAGKILFHRRGGAVGARHRHHSGHAVRSQQGH